ncbi:hypothetical protein [Phormidium nigroviride]
MPLDQVCIGDREARCGAISLTLYRNRSWKALPGERLCSQSLHKKLLHRYLDISVANNQRYQTCQILSVL